MDLISRSCEGIPLLITAFAANINEAQKTSTHSVGLRGRTAEFHSVEEGPQLPDQVRRALSHICRDLPVELMTLLQYMNMFPRGYMFEKDCLVMKWIAKGLTHSEGEAECHFSELVDRNIFTLVPPTGEHNLDEAEPCRWQVNKLVLQFISSIRSRAAFVFTRDMLTSLEPPTIRPFSEICMPRWLALHSPVPADIQGLMQTIDHWGQNVRSLAVSGLVDQVPLNKFNYLVMLDLEDWKNLKDEDLLQICNSKMYLLRYLSVRKTQVSKLPPQIKELCSLRTLDVSHTQISKLPSQAFELGHLIKLDLRSTKIRMLSEKIVGLQKLQHLLVGGDTTLSLIKYPLSFTPALGDLASLRVLAITCSFHQCSDEAYQDAWLSSLEEMEAARVFDYTLRAR
ncbi:disease resistance protein Pik-2-like [Panicum virgatum]|nr:disease resistance protein Pik-2-like [Panicum virgatum]